MHSAIYEGHVRHRRFSPVARLSLQPVHDVSRSDELPTLFEQNWLWSNEGLGLARFRRRDHLEPCTGHVRPEFRGCAIWWLSGLRFVPPGPIRLLTHLEYFRYRFNPVSFYFCFDRGGSARPGGGRRDQQHALGRAALLRIA
jgi:DUF1365 family protein